MNNLTRILFLDDDVNRHNQFDWMCQERKRWFKGQTNDYIIEHVWSVDEAQKAIFCADFDIWFLDHDLGDFKPDGSENDIKSAQLCPTGLDFCNRVWIMGLPKNPPHTVVIHSWNPEGAKQMEVNLRQSGAKNIVRDPF